MSAARLGSMESKAPALMRASQTRRLAFCRSVALRAWKKSLKPPSSFRAARIASRAASPRPLTAANPNRIWLGPVMVKSSSLELMSGPRTSMPISLQFWMYLTTSSVRPALVESRPAMNSVRKLALR